MKRNALYFDRPDILQANRPPEDRGLSRDEVRLLVSTPDGHRHSHFTELASFLDPGDLLVVNRSATLAASLTAVGAIGSFLVNFSTNYGNGLWLVEPRLSSAQPGPLPLEAGETIAVGGYAARLVAKHPKLPRLWFLQTDPRICELMTQVGRPIRYEYMENPYPLDAYQTVFSKIPGSAEMPSAARPFSHRVLASLRERGVKIGGILLHTGVSSLEIETDTVEEHPLYAEPFQVPHATAKAVNHARQEGRRVIAVGTTVVRALESAWNGQEVTEAKGFTQLMVHPKRGVHTIDGLITGLHDPLASHLAMLYAVAGQELILDGYREAVEYGYLWHEFGDSHLIIHGLTPYS